MSAIDQYKHRCLGTIECPSSFDFVYKSSIRKIAIYELLENIPDDERNFDGKAGDIIVGGGNGEAPAFRISIPGAFHFFTQQGWDDFNAITDLYKAFWTPTQSYILCEGFSKLGWTSNTPIESWLAENVCLLLIEEVGSYYNFKNDSLPKSIFTLSSTTNDIIPKKNHRIKTGFENIEKVIAVNKANSLEQVQQYLSSFKTWKPLSLNANFGYRWTFIPPSTKAINVNEAFNFMVIQKDNGNIFSLVFPDEKLLISYLNFLTEHDFTLRSNQVVDGAQHFAYESDELVIELGERGNKSYYISIYPGAIYERGERLT